MRKEWRKLCEILGISSRDDFYANDYLKAFYKRSKAHPHGWGLACVSRGFSLVEKESVQAIKSNYLRERLSQPINEKLLLAHIRYATIGNVDYQNSHPFTGKDNSGRTWTLIHNGTIFDYPALNAYVKIQRGETDSERIFLYLIDRINSAQNEKGSRLSFEERFKLLDEIICSMSKGNKLNLILTDGKYLYAHTNNRDCLHYLEKDNCTLLATKPFTDENWKQAPETQLLAYHKGKLVKAGTNHEHIYIESEEEMKLLYQIFANL